MEIIIKNHTTTVLDPSKEITRSLQKRLSFVDKSKQYQLKRMSKSVWSKNSPAFDAVKAQVDRTLLVEEPNQISFPSGLLILVNDIISSISITDLRSETGKKIALPWKNKPYALRDYQQEAVDLFPSNWRGLINFATGLGKTLTATYAIRMIGRKTLVVVPNKSIGLQFYEELASAFGRERIGFYGDGKKHIKDITVGIAPSVCNHAEEFKAADLGLIIFDETHHIAADTFFAISEILGDTGRIFGLTATDFRADGKDMMIAAGCGDTIIRRDVVWGVKNKWLAEPYFIIRKVPTTGTSYRDDKLKNYKTHVLNSAVMKKQIQDDAQKFLTAGKRVLIVVDEVAHGQELSQNLGIPFATGEDKDSQEYIKQFNQLKVLGLIGTEGKIGEGVDTKPVEVLIVANFVASKGAVLQVVGRGLRKIDGVKETCIILDYIPSGSEQLTRHANSRIGFYQEITDKVKIIHS